jgi:predicted Zn-dependent protease with MMP-like domain
MARPDVRTLEGFSELVRDAMDGLPEWLAPYLAELSIQVDEVGPSGEEDLYGVFDGASLEVDGYAELPPVITVFRRALVEDFGDDPPELERQVQITVAHELAHLFGFSEAQLDALGYG